jgi:hypothetical protein
MQSEPSFYEAGLEPASFFFFKAFFHQLSFRVKIALHHPSGRIKSVGAFFKYTSKNLTGHFTGPEPCSENAFLVPNLRNWVLYFSIILSYNKLISLTPGD